MQRTLSLGAAILAMLVASPSLANDGPAADEVLAPVTKRYSQAGAEEVPDFQRHVIPLFGRLGCNGRSCHGSFQGQGGFQLSLFGYDFKADHEALLSADDLRVDVDDPEASLIIAKPTDADMHDGGKRYDKGSWEHRLIQRWIEGGAKYAGEPHKLARLEVTPSEMIFDKAGATVELRAVAVWEDGLREDVTPLCRFQTNNEQVAKVDEQGQVTSGEPGDTHIVVSYDNAVVALPLMRPVSSLVGDKYPDVPTPTKVDELVVQKLRKLGIVPSQGCDDAEFLRRVRLDMTGTLPTAQEVEQFLADPSPDKRARKIDELLETPSYAAWWTTRLCDWTGNNEFQLRNYHPTNAASQEWYDWIYKRIAENASYDELAAGIILGVSRDPDESYLDYCREMSEIYHKGSDKSFADRESMPHYWARRELRQPEERAIAFAYSFMGIRIQCAQCHKHPFDQWSKDDFDQFKSFFTGINPGAVRPTGPARQDYDKMLADLGVKEVRNNNELRRKLTDALKEGKVIPFPEVAPTPARAPARRRGAAADSASGPTAKLLGAEVIDLSKQRDARKPLMDWLRAADNPYFARAFVNRVWSNYFGRGIVEPPDDLSLANPPSNKPLLDWLTQGFIDSGFDMKWLHRAICNSRTYQLSWQPNETNGLDETNFSRAMTRRLPAEVAYDALQQATASDAKVAELHANMKDRAVAIAGSSSRGNRTQFALTVFGRSIRESNCDCDRSMEPSLLQTVFLQNDQEMLAMIDRRNDGWIDQVSRQLRGGRQASAGDAGADAESNLANMERQLERLREAGRDEQAERLQTRLTALRRQQARAAREAGPAEPAASEKFDGAELVKQAYLRTLSRYPAHDELERSLAYLDESEDKVRGLRDLLWVLVNTKEFIVNH